MKAALALSACGLPSVDWNQYRHDAALRAARDEGRNEIAPFVKRAYISGFGAGIDDAIKPRGGKSWHDFPTVRVDLDRALKGGCNG